MFGVQTPSSASKNSRWEWKRWVWSANTEFSRRTLKFGLRTFTFGVQTLSSVCEPSCSESKHLHVRSPNAKFGLQTLSSVCEPSRSECQRWVRSANTHVWSPNTEFSLRTFRFGVQTLSLVCKHWVRSANTHVLSPNTEFGLWTFTLGAQLDFHQMTYTASLHSLLCCMLDCNMVYSTANGKYKSCALIFLQALRITFVNL